VGWWLKLDKSKKVRHLTLMDMIYSKITSKAQTVLPKQVRELLGVKPGDRLSYKVTKQGVVIDKVTVANEDDPFAVFSEWSSAADEKAYGKL
jgi:antitoxin PrlF